MSGISHRLAALSLIAACAISAAPAHARWSDVFVDTPGAGGPACMALSNFDDGTIVTLKRDRGDHSDGVVVMMVVNLDWSISENDNLGEIDLVHGTDGIAVNPYTDDHGFFFYAPDDLIRGFVDELTPSGFAFYRDGNAIARFPQDGFADVVRSLLACGSREFR